MSDNIHNDKLIFKYNYIPETLNDIPAQLYFCKEFDWNIDFQEKTNMAMLHLHSLEPIKYLLLSYNKSKNIDLLYKSIEILISWNTHSHKKTNFYTWYTHCVTERTLIIGTLLTEMINNNYKIDIILKIQNILKM